jgi:selenocysteine-specific elongation factor
VLAPDSAQPSTLLDVQLELLPTAPPLPHRSRVRVHHGSAELIGRVVLLDRDELAPGETAKAQLVLERPAVASLGDRLVIRRYSPAVVIGGGQVLHPAPAKHKRNQAGTLAALDSLEAGDVLGALDQALAHAGRRPLAEETLVGFAPADQQEAARAWLAANAFKLPNHQYLHKATAEGIAKDLEAALSAYHAKVNWRLGLDKEELAKRTKLPLGVVARVLGALPLRKQGRFYSLQSFQVQQLPEAQQVLAKLQAMPLADAEDLGKGERLPAILEDLVEAGEAVRISGGFYATPAHIEAMKATLSTLPTFTASQAREALGTTRKYIIPFLEHLDSVGFTRRQGDVRALAPR